MCDEVRPGDNVDWQAAKASHGVDGDGGAARSGSGFVDGLGEWFASVSSSISRGGGFFEKCVRRAHAPRGIGEIQAPSRFRDARERIDRLICIHGGMGGSSRRRTGL
jgi:hypothetical protein